MGGEENIKFVDGFKLYENLSMIRRNPKIALTEKSISALSNYLWGYLIWGTRDNYNKSIYNEGDPNFSEFRYWLNDQPNIALTTGPPFHNILLDVCNNDEEKAFDLFFSKLDEFFVLKGREPYVL